MRKTLLHTCCGPCACACVPRLREMGREVTMLFANSNIDTREEFERRLKAAEQLAAADGVKLVALPYDHDEWLRAVAAGYEDEPEQGARCARCFRYNLAQAAAYAAEHGYDEFTTSLTVSPHKVTKTVFAAAYAAEHGCDECATSPTVSPHKVTKTVFAAAEAAAEHGCDEFTTSPTVSPHKVTKTVFAAAEALSAVRPRSAPAFLPVDFKKREGFLMSTRRAAELGLYRQSYCGCEFSQQPTWRIHHRAETASTNLDARAGRHGDVFTADFQTAGRGRLDHKWLSPPGTNLMMSVVLSAEGIPPEQLATLPLVIGLAVVEAAQPLLGPPPAPPHGGLSPQASAAPARPSVRLKWPNDVLVGGRKLAGILCERHGDQVIAGVGVNVGQTDFAAEIAEKATSFAILSSQIGVCPQVETVRSAILRQIGRWYGVWKARGFAAVLPAIRRVDFLRGQTVSVRQTDDDAAPVCGVSGGILADGSLDVGGVQIYAGEVRPVGGANAWRGADVV